MKFHVVNIIRKKAAGAKKTDLIIYIYIYIYIYI
jgi:hypothetical protein